MPVGHVVALAHEDEQEPDPSIVPPGPIDEEPSSRGLDADNEAAEVDNDES